MKEKVLLKTEAHRKAAINYLMDIPLEPVHEISIKEHKADRSAAQNRLLWKWMTEIGDHYGELKEDVHERYKAKFLVHIFQRDNDDYAFMLQAVRDVYTAGAQDRAKILEKGIIFLTHTRDANTKQFAEYLNSIEVDCSHNQIGLTHPDVYEQAVGKLVSN